MPFVGLDWRSPGDKWIRTEFGWKRLSEIRITLNTQIVQQLRNLSLSLGVSSNSNNSSRSSSRNSKNSSRQLSRKASPVGDGEVKAKRRLSSSDLPCCSHSNTKEREKRLRQLNLMLAQRCILVGTRSSSRESNRYSTISDAVNKLNFHQALYDENCFQFICKVVIILFESYYWTLSGSLQTTLLRITETAKDIVMENMKHSGLVLKITDRAIATLEKGRQQHTTGFALRSIDSKIKPLLKLKRQFQSFLLDPTRYQSDNAVFLSMSYLPNDCLRQIVSHLSHPRDVLNLGQTCSRLHSITEENWVWKDLTQYHYGRVDYNLGEDFSEQNAQWKQVFCQQYRLSKGRLHGEISHAVSLCNICNYVFWKSYGHPCSDEANSSKGNDGNRSKEKYDAAPQTTQGLTAEQFLSLFVS